MEQYQGGNPNQQALATKHKNDNDSNTPAEDGNKEAEEQEDNDEVVFLGTSPSKNLKPAASALSNANQQHGADGASNVPQKPQSNVNNTNPSFNTVANSPSQKKDASKANNQSSDRTQNGVNTALSTATAPTSISNSYYYHPSYPQPQHPTMYGPWWPPPPPPYPYYPTQSYDNNKNATNSSDTEAVASVAPRQTNAEAQDAAANPTIPQQPMFMHPPPPYDLAPQFHNSQFSSCYSYPGTKAWFDMMKQANYGKSYRDWELDCHATPGQFKSQNASKSPPVTTEAASGQSNANPPSSRIQNTHTSPKPAAKSRKECSAPITTALTTTAKPAANASPDSGITTPPPSEPLSVPERKSDCPQTKPSATPKKTSHALKQTAGMNDGPVPIPRVASPCTTETTQETRVVSPRTQPDNDPSPNTQLESDNSMSQVSLTSTTSSELDVQPNQHNPPQDRPKKSSKVITLWQWNLPETDDIGSATISAIHSGKDCDLVFDHEAAEISETSPRVPSPKANSDVDQPVSSRSQIGTRFSEAAETKDPDEDTILEYHDVEFDKRYLERSISKYGVMSSMLCRRPIIRDKDNYSVSCFEKIPDCKISWCARQHMGIRHQARIPHRQDNYVFDCEYEETNEDEDEESGYQQLWDPILADEAEKRGEDIQTFLKQGTDLTHTEFLMELLHWRHYSVQEASNDLRRMTQSFGIPTSKLTPYEGRSVERLLKQHRKDFETISKLVGRQRADCLIHYYNWKRRTIYPNLKKEWKSDWCTVCDDGGNLIICDTCERAYHLGCADPPLKNIPVGDWYCHNCIADPRRNTPVLRGANRRVTSITGEMPSPFSPGGKRKESGSDTGVDHRVDFAGPNQIPQHAYSPLAKKARS